MRIQGCLVVSAAGPTAVNLDFLDRSRCRWIDKIKMDLLEIGVNVVDWIGLAQDRYRWRALVNSVMNLWVP
jgi:hypothetical protein